MTTTDIIELIGIVTAFIIGVISIIIAIRSNKYSKSAITISKESNTIAANSLKISKEIKKESEEFVSIKQYGNLELNYSTEYIYKGKKCFDDLVLIVPTILKNTSTNPVSISRPSMFWGNGDNYNYLSEDDFYIVKGLNEENKFPIYLLPKETRIIKIIIGFNDSDRQMLYSEKGLTLCFEGTKNTYKRYFKISNIIDSIDTMKTK